MKLEFLQHSFKKFSNIESDENPSFESRVITSEREDGRMEGRKDWKTGKYDEANSHLSQFGESA